MGESTPAADDRPTPEEDAVLRRLHWFEKFGAELAPRADEVKSDIRARDKRAEIREPPDVVDAQPVYDLDADLEDDGVDEPEALPDDDS